MAVYAWLKSPVSRRKREKNALVIKIEDAFKKSMKTYGSPRITAEPKKDGIACSENRIARLMRNNGIAVRQ